MISFRRLTLVVLTVLICITGEKALHGNMLFAQSPTIGSPITPATAYEVSFSQLMRAESEVAIRVHETNGDFNSADETLKLFMDEAEMATIMFDDTNAEIVQTHSFEMMLTAEDFNRHLVHDTLSMTLLTSSQVDQSYGARFNPSTDKTSFFEVEIEYEAVPEPNALACSVLLILLCLRRRSTGTRG